MTNPLQDTTMVVLTIYGVLASGKNSRIITRTKAGRMMSIKSERAQGFRNDFLKQIPYWAKKGLEGDIALTARIYYPSRRSDLDDTLLCDLIQEAGIILNDRQIKEKHLYGYVDPKNPRVEFAVRFNRQRAGSFGSDQECNSGTGTRAKSR